jgi:hypothetical protein
MKRTMLIAALFTVGACSEAESETAPEAAEVAAAPEVMQPLAADGLPAVGNYKITTSDGEVLMEELRADGTYTATKDGQVVETGRWVQTSPELYCYTKDEEGATEQCNTEVVDEGGVWTSRDAEGNVATVERVPA